MQNETTKAAAAKAMDNIEGRTLDAEKDSATSQERPAAGPHAKPELTNAAATPGAGALPSDDDQDVEAGTG